MLNNPSFFTLDTIHYSFIWDDCIDVSEQVELYVYYINGEIVECCNIDNPILITYANKINIKEIHQVIQNYSIDEKSFKFKIKRSNENLQSAILFPVENISLHPSVSALAVYSSERNIFNINGNSACQILYQNTDTPLMNYDVYVSEKKSETPPDWTKLEWRKIETDFILDNTNLPLTLKGNTKAGLNLDTEYYITLNYNRLMSTTYDFQTNLFNTINQDVVNRELRSLPAAYLYHIPNIYDIEDKELLYLQKASYSTACYTIELGDYSDGTFIKQKTLILKVGETYNVSQYKYIRVSSSYDSSDYKDTIDFTLFSYRENETTKLGIISEFKTAKAYSHDYEAFKGLESLTAYYDENEHKYICSYQKIGPNNNELYIYQQFNDTYILCNNLQYKNQADYDSNKCQFFLLDPDVLTTPNNEKSYNVIVSDFAVKDKDGQNKINNISQEEIDDIVTGLKGYEYKCSLYKIANYKTQEHPEGAFEGRFYLDVNLIESQQQDVPLLTVKGMMQGGSEIFELYKNHSFDFIIQSTITPNEQYVFGWGNLGYTNIPESWFLYDKETGERYQEKIYLDKFSKNFKHTYKIMIKAYSLNKKRYEIIYEDYIDYNNTHFLQGLGYNYYPCGNKKQDNYTFELNNQEIDTQLYDNLEILKFNDNKYFEEKQIFTSSSIINVSNLDKIVINEIVQQGGSSSGEIVASFDEDFLTNFIVTNKMEIDVSLYNQLYVKYIKNYGYPSAFLQYYAYVNKSYIYGEFYKNQIIDDSTFTYSQDKQNIYYNTESVLYDLKSIDKILYNKVTPYEFEVKGIFNYADYYQSYKEKPNKNFGISIEKENVTDDIPSVLYDDSEDLNNILYFGYSKNAQINQDYTNAGLHNYDTDVINAVSKVSIFPKNTPLQKDMFEEKIWLTFKLTEMIQKNCIQNNMYPIFSIEQGDFDNYRNRFDHNKKKIYFKASIENPNAEIHINFGKQVIINNIKNLYATNCKTIEIRDEQDFVWYKGENITESELILLNNQKIKCKELFIYITSVDGRIGRIESDDLQILLLEKAVNPDQENKGLRNRFVKTDNIRLFLNTGDYLDYNNYINNGQEIQGLVLNNNQPVNFYIEQFSDLQDDTYEDLIYKLEIIKTEHLLFDLLPNDDNIISLTQENKNKKIFTKDFNINSYTNNLTIKNSKIKKITFKKCQQDTLVNCFLEKEDRKE